ncbi:unannotated protein [freshwater metagenome]|uniref:Unannotated protein n=1 Tax=freshwater metagenome TaxID=449393 RepID=A0A6J7S3G2_9ZZZZ
MNVAKDRCQHDGALCVALDTVKEVLKPRDCTLHNLCRLQNEGENQFAGAELVADLLHCRQQDLVECWDGADLLNRGVDPVLNAFLAAAQDVEVERLFGLHSFGRVRLLCLRVLATTRFKVVDEKFERVFAAVEDEIIGQGAFLVGDLAVRGDVVGVDHRQVEAGVNAMVEEDRVEYGAGAGGDAERDVRDSKRGLDAGDLSFDPADAFDRLDRRWAPLFVTSRQRESQRVEDQQLRVEAVFVAAKLLKPQRDLDLALGCLRHPDLIDRQRDHCRTVLDGHRYDGVELVAAGLKVDRVDDCAARDLVERGGDHGRLG